MGPRCTELTTGRWRKCGDLGRAWGWRPGDSGVCLHALLQLLKSLDKLLRVLVGAALQHPQR